MTEHDLDEAEATPSVSHHSERDAALAAVLRHEAEMAEKEEAYRERVERKHGWGVRHIALGVSTVLALWAWIFPPGIIQIEPVPPQPLHQEEAALRLAVYFQAQRIEQYRADNGRIPAALADAGPAFRGMEYIRLTDTHYRILGRTDRLAVSFASTQDARDWVGPGSGALDVSGLR